MSLWYQSYEIKKIRDRFNYNCKIVLMGGAEEQKAGDEMAASTGSGFKRPESLSQRPRGAHPIVVTRQSTLNGGRIVRRMGGLSEYDHANPVFPADNGNDLPPVSYHLRYPNLYFLTHYFPGGTRAWFD